MRACFDGRISRVEQFRLTGYGRSIYLQSNDGKYNALYAHLSSTIIKLNDLVKIGTVLGSSGNSGFYIGKTGYHLHFGISKYGEYVDPLPILNDMEIGKQALPLYTYTVKEGDTLSSIAKAYYKNANKWPEIFEANQDKIKNSDLIFPGQILNIPGL